MVKIKQFSLWNMQRHTKSISFGLFLKLNISGSPHLGELIFWIYTNNASSYYNNTVIKTLFIFELLNVEVFGKSAPIDRYDKNFIIWTNNCKIFLLQNSLHLTYHIFWDCAGQKSHLKDILPDFVSYWHSKYVTKNKSRTVFKEVSYKNLLSNYQL